MCPHNKLVIITNYIIFGKFFVNLAKILTENVKNVLNFLT